MLHMLDTDTARYVIKGRWPGVEARLSAIEPAMLCLSVITRAELMYGLKRLPPSHLLHAGVRQFLRIVPVLAWGAAAADFYADIRGQLTSEGRKIGEMDMMIAAHALAVNAVLVTSNTRHFQCIAAPLMMVNWADP